MTYETKIEVIQVGSRAFQICGLLDPKQGPIDVIFTHENSNTGITETNWPLFGSIWASSRVLAETMDQLDCRGLRILEVGCGLALPGLVAHSKGYDVTLSDFHPNAEEFLLRNLTLNNLPPLPYREANWSKTYDDLGLFDLIIGSDILYDRGHASLLANFLDRHLKPRSQVIVADPGRQTYRQFTREMEQRGFNARAVTKALANTSSDTPHFHMLTFERG